MATQLPILRTGLSAKTSFLRVAVRLLFLIIMFVSATVLAQPTDSSDTPELPADIPSLPSAGDGHGVVVNSENASVYKDIILPELYDLVRRGIMEMEAAKGLSYGWRYDDEWEENSSNVSDSLLSTNGALRDGAVFKRGWLFGPRAIVAQESDPKKLGTKVLWNVVSSLAGHSAISIDFDLLFVKENTVRRKISGALTRDYSRAVNQAAEAQGRLFRELIRFNYPQAVSGFSWLTFRFIGSIEDVMWVYSQTNQKSREITGSNRSDGMLTSSISPDDMFVWSGKTELVAPVVAEKIVALAPFPVSEAARGSAASPGCDEVTLATAIPGGGRARWNLEVRRFINGAGWLPAHAVYVPREMWRVEMASLDPFSLYSRQILYVDTVSQLPLFKVVYDRRGNHWKTVMGSFGMALLRGSTRKVPVYSFMIVLDHLAEEAYVLDVSKMTVCDASPLPPEAFDPRRLGVHEPTVTHTPSAATLPAST